ncbi:DUF6164 family protein [Pseudohongiella spirulinae]|uniref:DUF2007 domain-containing protein n=1 Tax=Pseudohongiella spirulinae TaxID=1249552 RepID=A0A0S2K927_9GAMM|nr:DUF6164 family protein [Pseudohongiella spirulinae]ALO44833.1 hypothetical protein PS2015_138 [Pseudohongiella spirulinae]
MARLLFRLRNVPDDEAADVKELLESNGIEFYETTAGNWGISMPGLWLRHDQDYDLAASLLQHYQSERSQRLRAQYEADKAAGRADTQLTQLQREPLKVIGYFILVALIIYISVTLFF